MYEKLNPEKCVKNMSRVFSYFCYFFYFLVVAQIYAQNLIVVAFLVVNFFVCLVITRNHTMRFGPKLEEIFL